MENKSDHSVIVFPKFCLIIFFHVFVKKNCLVFTCRWTVLHDIMRFCVLLAMEFHENLQSLAVKEGLKGRKVSRALESFSWNITILKVRGSQTHTYVNIKSQRPMLNTPLSLTTCSRLYTQGQADLLKRAKAEVQENMKQVHDAALTGNLSKESQGVTRVRSQIRKGQDDKTATGARGGTAWWVKDTQNEPRLNFSCWEQPSSWYYFNIISQLDCA